MYTIYRFRFNKCREFVASGLTLEQAQAHCRDPKTHGEGWFDGYEEEKNEESLTNLLTVL